jgi:hypothetical protein
MTPAQIATIIRCVLYAHEPISTAQLDQRTGYGISSVIGALMDLQAAGDVETSQCDERITCWQMTPRWADASPWHGTSRQHTLHAAGFAGAAVKAHQTARAALALIAVPRRPDGSWSRDREACQQLAAEALRSYDE